MAWAWGEMGGAALHDEPRALHSELGAGGHEMDVPCYTEELSFT